MTSASFSTFDNQIDPVAVGPQLTFPSLQDGSSFRVPQGTEQKRFQLSDTVTLVKGAHMLRVGGEWQRVDADFDLDVFRQGRIEFVEDFAGFDHNGDGRVDDGDLLFAVTLRSGKPDQGLVIPDADNHYLAGFIQDEWRLRSDLTLNSGLRYEVDTDVKNIVAGGRDQSPRAAIPQRDAPARSEQPGAAHRLQLVTRRRAHKRSRRLRHLLRPRHPGDSVARTRARWTRASDRGAGWQRVLRQSGDRAVSAFCAVDAQPVHRLHPAGAGASGINIIDNTLQNPSVQQFNLGVQHELPGRVVLRVDGVHDFGTHFIIGRTVGEVYNPVVGGPDRVVNLESSVDTKYDALLVSAEQRATDHGFRASYTLEQGIQLLERRPDSICQRSYRPDRISGSSMVPRQTISDIVSPWRAGHESPAVSWWRRSGRSRRGCRWISSCPTRSRACRCSSEMRVGACSRRRRR